MADQSAPAAPNMPVTVKSTDVHDEHTVIMVFPHPVLLTVHATKRILFREGVQNVPVSLQDHFYLKAHGVKLFVPNVTTPPEQQAQQESEERIRKEELAAAEQKAKDEAAEAQRIATQRATDERKAAEAQQVMDAAESARTGKPVDQIRVDRETKAGKAKAAK